VGVDLLLAGGGVMMLNADAALLALRTRGLRVQADERQPEGLWIAQCPECIFYHDDLRLTVREGQRGGPVSFSCRKGCDPGKIAGRLFIDTYTEAAQSDERSPNGGRAIVAESFASIRAEHTHWLWDGRIPLRAPTLLVGREKLGKSTLTVALAAGVSRGTYLPHRAVRAR
jgi:hypothetical protein